MSSSAQGPRSRLGVPGPDGAQELAVGHDDLRAGPAGGEPSLGGGLRGTSVQMGAGVAQVVLDLARLQQWVHRDDDRTGAQHGVVEDRELHDVGQHDADTVAGLDAASAHPARGARTGSSSSA